MSRDLTTFRNHCRQMVDAAHRPGCVEGYKARVATWERTGEGKRPERCPGCVSEEDRVLWAVLAEEADAHLRRAAVLADEPVAVEPCEDDVPLIA